MNDWSPGLKIVDSFLLLVSVHTKSSFEFLDASIWIAFDFECPSAREDVFARVENIFPTIKFLGKSVEFGSHCLPKLGLERTASGGVKQRVIFVLFCHFDTRLKHTWVGDLIEVTTIVVPRI